MPNTYERKPPPDPTTDPAVRADVVVLLIQYDQPVGQEVLEIWEDTSRNYEGVIEVRATYGKSPGCAGQYLGSAPAPYPYQTPGQWKSRSDRPTDRTTDPTSRLGYTDPGTLVRDNDTGRTGVTINAGSPHRAPMIAWDDAASYPTAVRYDQFTVIGYDPQVDHVIYRPDHPSHGKRRSEVVS